MSFSKSSLAFEDIREVFNKALEAQKGLRVPCTSRGSAIALRSRFHYFRMLDREDSKTIYPAGHPLHGRTVYDRLVLRVAPKGAPDETFLYIEHRLAENLEIEEL
jgi:hypothetical protein